MNILMSIGHPGHVHLLRNTYWELIKNKHKVFLIARDIPIIIKLLKLYNIPYVKIGEKKDSLFQKGWSQIKNNKKVYDIVKTNNIEIGIGSTLEIAHISKISKMKSIILDDDDDDVQPLFVKSVHPFSDVVLSPIALKGNRKKKDSVFYSGYHELSYLHPNRFTPDENVLKELNLKKSDKFFIMRFNVFKAHHDIGVKGLSLSQKLKLIEVLEPYGKIFITTERGIEPELKKYQLKISPEKAHSLMSYSTMFLGDSQTMTSEAAVLGIPAIRCNSLVGRISYLEEEEHKYDLTYGFLPENFEKMLIKVENLLKNENLKLEWENKKQKMLKDKIDVTKFFVWFIENYPQSKKIMMNQQDYDLNFK